MLDVPVLLAAVSSDSPCGDDLEYDAAFLELERIAQGQPERQMGDAVLPAEPPEWPRVRALASELFGRSKDLRVANLLLQSNVALDGLDGLADGLLLVRELLGQYWDGVYPLLDADDDNDPTFRINALTGLVAEPLLQLVWAIPLVRSRAFGPVNLRAALNAAGLQRFASETLSPEQIAGAFADADADALAATRRALEGAQEHALAIESGVAERVGSAQGLDLGPLRQLLRQALQVFDLYGPQGAGEPLAPGAEAAADEQGGRRACRSRRRAGTASQRRDRQPRRRPAPARPPARVLRSPRAVEPGAGAAQARQDTGDGRLRRNREESHPRWDFPVRNPARPGKRVTPSGRPGQRCKPPGRFRRR
ncbi:type VI secretion system protein TssA [Pseudomonas aeruginosa]|uniref:type VI secretion system protein TssA n=1 Tax=Pseudomonas aeruginosa TaxID=287 RepID=UPI001EDF437E|nr:type VI secretion system protein TssA [Pseudomonas aeruginosa]